MTKKKTPRKPREDGKVAAGRTKELLRSLPSVSSLLEREEVVEWLHGLPRSCVVAAIQTTLDRTRRAMLDGGRNHPVDTESLLAEAEEELLRRSMPSLTPVINASGIVLHTGLGRAPLSAAAVEAIAETASGYCNLEYDLTTGSRGKRHDHVTGMLTELTGAESAAVVNNNAAALVLILRTFAEGREVVVSRGQLIEIGGSFRLPDIMRAGGATLVEVGTTNRTRITDYEKAVHDQTAILLRAHPSNFRVIGFTEETALASMAELAHRFNLIAVDDLGSGALFETSAYGLPAEPSVQASVDAGADLVCFSGDKLLGGPQCGLIVGRAALIESLNQHPLMRTYRVDKLTLAALDATLRAYLDPDEALRTIPALAMLSATTEALETRARTLIEKLEAALPDERFLICSDVAFAGGGSMPGREIPTVVVQWRPTAASASEIAAALRRAETPVIVRIRDDAICFDLRTLGEGDFESVVAAATETLWEDKDEEKSDGTSLPVLGNGASM